jgi:hypothetical protein
MPVLKDLQGGTRLRIDPEGTVVRDFRLRGAATEVLARLSLREGKPDGIVYARYGLISAGLDYRNGGSDWTIFGAKRKYKQALREMKLDLAEAPEGDDEPAK